MSVRLGTAGSLGSDGCGRPGLAPSGDGSSTIDAEAPGIDPQSISLKAPARDGPRLPESPDGAAQNFTILAWKTQARQGRSRRETP